MANLLIQTGEIRRKTNTRTGPLPPCYLSVGLIGLGLARTDRHGLGIEVTDTLRIVDGTGAPAAAAWALGPIVRGMFWECTAVPDIRIQARTVADQMARHLVRDGARDPVQQGQRPGEGRT